MVIYNKNDEYATKTIKYLVEKKGVKISDTAKRLIIVPKREIKLKNRLAHNKIATKIGMALFKKGSKMRAVLKSKI